MIIIPLDLDDETCDNLKDNGAHKDAKFQIKWDHPYAEATYLCIPCLLELRTTIDEVFDDR